MCGVQIGRAQLASILAHGAQTEKLNQQACGLQVGAEELTAIMAHSAKTATASGKAACGVQVGFASDVDEEAVK